MVVRVRRSEPIFNQQSGNMVTRVPRDRNKRIHSVNRVRKPNSILHILPSDWTSDQ
jgi:hypothetical protein